MTLTQTQIRKDVANAVFVGVKVRQFVAPLLVEAAGHPCHACGACREQVYRYINHAHCADCLGFLFGLVVNAHACVKCAHEYDANNQPFRKLSEEELPRVASHGLCRPCKDAELRNHKVTR